MSQKLHPGPHPDTDQLSIFVEGADTAREHEQMLLHLAECEECRDVVFLMQLPADVPSAAKETPTGWMWNRWFLPTGLAGAAVAGLAVLLLYIQPWAKTPEVTPQNVAVVQPRAEAGGTSAAPNTNPPPAAPLKEAKNGSEPSMATTNAVGEKPASAAIPKSSDVRGNPASAATATDATGAQAGAALNPNAHLDVNSASARDLPLNGRNITSLQPLKTPAPAATPRNGLNAQQNLPRLLVDRSIDQIQLASGVSGHVSDASGGVIAGATVALRDATGSTARQTSTGADGSFQLAGLPAGHYVLTITAPGFASDQQPLDLKQSEVAVLQPTLAVGSVSQTVEVTASAAALQTETASIVSTAKRPGNLPIAGSVSLGKRILSLDSTGSVFLSGNAGKSWKKVAPQWTGKAVNIDLTGPEANEARKEGEASGGAGTQSLFRLTTDSGVQWTSPDGRHWRPNKLPQIPQK